MYKTTDSTVQSVGSQYSSSGGAEETQLYFTFKSKHPKKKKKTKINTIKDFFSAFLLEIENRKKERQRRIFPAGRREDNTPGASSSSCSSST